MAPTKATSFTELTLQTAYFMFTVKAGCTDINMLHLDSAKQFQQHYNEDDYQYGVQDASHFFFLRLLLVIRAADFLLWPLRRSAWYCFQFFTRLPGMPTYFKPARVQ